MRTGQIVCYNSGQSMCSQQTPVITLTLQEGPRNMRRIPLGIYVPIV
jgi:hypothetical protein